MRSPKHQEMQPSTQDLAILQLEIDNELNARERPAGGMTTRFELIASRVENTYEVAVDAKPFITSTATVVENVLENAQILVQALDEISKIHPVIAVAVRAFTTAFSMYKTMKANDDKITELYVEMSDMIEVLLILKDISCADMTLLMTNGLEKHRLEELSKRTAQDIGECAQYCKGYDSRRRIVKVLAASLWNKDLARFGALFAARKQEFLLAVDMHTAKRVNGISQQLRQSILMQTQMMSIMGVKSTKFAAWDQRESERMQAVIADEGPDVKTKEKVQQRPNLTYEEEPQETPDDVLRRGTSDPRFHMSDVSKSMLKDMSAFIAELDMVSRIHPTFRDTVETFKVTYSFYETRQDNDGKVIELHVELREMIVVLCQLKDVSSAQMMQYNGSKSHLLEELLQRTARDIRDFANHCDTYSRKKTLYKALAGQMWEDAFVHFAGMFAARKQEFLLALAACIGEQVFEPTHEFRSQDAWISAIKDAKMHQMRQRFALLTSTEQRKLEEHIRQEGGFFQVISDDKKLTKLLLAESAYLGEMATANDAATRKVIIQELHRELEETLQEATQRNMRLFESKMEIIRAGLKRDMEKIVERETDRVIQEINLTRGPQQMIIDRDVHKLWVDMGWRGHVNSNQFVHALRDYYVSQPYTSDNASQDLIRRVDFFQFNHVLEVFDDDTSGIITVPEVNRFTCSRPRDWTLPEWVTFWAVGWQASMVQYTDNIHKLCAKMFTIGKHVLPKNRSSVDRYLNVMGRRCFALVGSIDDPDQMMHPSIDVLSSGEDTEGPGPVSLLGDIQDKFQGYMAEAEASLETTLAYVNYEIDSLDMLRMSLASHHHIERMVLPLIYLLLKHHFHILCTALHETSDNRVLNIAAETLELVFHGIHIRAEELKDMFTLRGLDVKSKFSYFACGLFKAWSDEICTPAYVKNMRTHVYSLEDADPSIKEIPTRNEDGSPLVEFESDSALRALICTRVTSSDEEEDIIEHPNVFCDCCGKSIKGARIICLAETCLGKEVFDSLDLCEDPRCRDADVNRSDLVVPHLHSHDIMKVQAVLHLPFFGLAYETAITSLAKAREMLHDGVDRTTAPKHWTEMGSDVEATRRVALGTVSSAVDMGDTSGVGVCEEEQPPMSLRPRCMACKKHVKLACWYCVECPDIICPFICLECESARSATPDSHDWKHTIVLCRSKEESEASTQLIALRQEVAGLREVTIEQREALEEMREQNALQQRQFEGKMVMVILATALTVVPLVLAMLKPRLRA